MTKVRVYLDNCCFNRPFDDQSQTTVKLETLAKLSVQKKISSGEIELVWSYILEHENNQNPHTERLSSVRDWKDISAVRITATEEIISAAEEFKGIGLKPKDALHVACATAAGADYFLTTDKKILNKPIEGEKVVNPIDFIREQEVEDAK
jgi:predicted nucleic acid-binding protein